MIRLLHAIRRLLIIGVIGWAVLTLLIRGLTPWLGSQRDNLAELLSRHFGVPVEIAGLRASWIGVGPELRLHGVRIGRAPEQLVLEDAKLDFEPLFLLRERSLQALRLVVEGVAIHVVRETSGQIHLHGLGGIALRAQAAPDTAASPLPLPNHLRIRNARLVWEDRMLAKPALILDAIDIESHRDGERLRLKASLRTSGGQARLIADLHGLLARTDWSGRTYLHIADLDLADLLRQYLPAHYRLDSMQLNLDLWNDWRDARPFDSSGHLQVKDLHMHTQAGGEAVAIEQLGGDFRFQRAASNWTLQLAKIQVQRDGHVWPSGRLALRRTEISPQQGKWQLAADYLRLDDVAHVLGLRMPNPDLQRMLARLRPRGDLHNLTAGLTSRPDGIDTWWVKSDFSRLGVDPWQDIPGVEGLSGGIDGNQDLLHLDLASTGVAVDTAGLFRWPLQIERLTGPIYLHNNTSGWRIDSPALVVDTPHISTVSRLHIAGGGGQPLFMDLQGDFRDGEGIHAPAYYPTAIMGAPLVRWLDESVLAGHVTAGSVLVHGPLRDFPFATNHNGIFEVAFHVRDGLLRYQPGWPALEDLDANLLFHGNQLDITLNRGRIYTSEVTHATGHISSLNPAGTLAMQGEIAGPLADKLHLLTEDAFRDRFGHIAAALQAEGDARLSLDFAVPLGEFGDYRLAGRLAFADNRLRLPDWNLDLSQARGNLDFTLDSLRAQNITVRTLDSQVRIDVKPGRDGATRVSARGDIAAAAIVRQVPQLPAAIAQGQAPFAIDIDIPAVSAPPDTPSVLTVTSNLDGMALALPQPLGKTATEQRALRVRMPLSGHTRSVPLEIDFGTDIRARFSADWQSGDIAFGGAPATLSRQPGYRLRGRVKRVEVDGWEILMAARGNAAPTAPSLIDADLDIDELWIGGLRIPELALVAQSEGGRWRGSASTARFDGRFDLPADRAREPLRVNLHHLNIPLEPYAADAPPDSPAAPPDSHSGPDPRTWPALELSCDRLTIGKADFGEFQVVARRSLDGLVLERARMHGGEVEVHAEGSWLYRSTGPRTKLLGRATNADLGGLLDHLGYPQIVEKGGGGLSFDLSWPGNPAQFHGATLTGELDLVLGRGRLLEIDPGAAKLTGLLNLGTLGRRLRLDFSDLYGQGLAFDQVSGHFYIDLGQAYTNDLALEGPGGRIDFGGRLGLVDRDLDQIVAVNPRLDATLPLAGTLAGGPVAGLAVLLAQSVLGDRIRDINRLEYSISGPWAEPLVTPLEGGSTLSRLLQSLGGGTQPGADEAANNK